MKKVKTNTLILLSTLICGIMAVAEANATAYQDRAQVKFTFNPTLTLDLSSTSLSIDELLPGTSRDSNAIDITVDTNNIGGYTLSATVGDVSNASTSLVHTDGSATFSSVGYGSFSSLADGKWGYSIDSGEHYSGLPLYSNGYGATLAHTKGASPSDTTSFLIGAKAAADQPLGAYSNVVNFIAVANVYITPTLQTVTDVELAAMLPNVGDTAEIKDERDCKTYRIGKLADGNIWFLDDMRMTTDAECAEWAGGTYVDIQDNDAYDYSMSNAGYIFKYYNDDYLGTKIYDPDDHNIVLGEKGVVYNFCAASNGWCAEPFVYDSSMGGGGGEGCWEDPFMCDPMYGEETARQEYMDQVIGEYGTTISTGICPEGWVMPSSSDFSNLAGAYSTPNDFVRAAKILPTNEGYWTNAVTANSSSFEAYHITGSVTPQSGAKYSYTGPTTEYQDRSDYALVRCKRA